jgi:hypothetical protein
VRLAVGLIISLSLLSGAPLDQARARFYPDPKVSLAGLPGVFVVVEDVAPQAARDGLTRAIIRRDVLTRLRAAGVPLLTRAKWLKTPGWPMLSVVVSAYKSRHGVYAAYLGVRLRQVVSLKRLPDVDLAGTTWKAEFVAVARPNHLSAVRRYLGVLIDRFIRAWRAANRQRR